MGFSFEEIVRQLKMIGREPGKMNGNIRVFAKEGSYQGGRWSKSALT